jgi:hypothetical protein
MKITYNILGYHSSYYLCSYCKKTILSKDDKYCTKNVIYTKDITIIPSFDVVKNSFL